MLDLNVETTLIELERLDREKRKDLADTGELFEGYPPDMERVHLSNARQLEAIIDRVGWPGCSVAGEAGAEAAWRIAQHAISWPAFQLRCRRLLKEAVAAGDAPAQHLAFLTDRIRFNQRRPQLYGTIHDWDEKGELSPWPCENPQRLDQRRRSVGLGPLEEATAALRLQAETEGDRPSRDYAKRQREMLKWARGVGWLDDWSRKDRDSP